MAAPTSITRCVGLLTGLTLGSLTSAAYAASVCASGCDFATIDAALNNAPAGEMIEVDPGNYSEPRLTVVNRTLRSTGNRDNTTITNNSTQAVIQASNATIEGFTIQNGNNVGGHGGGVAVSGGTVTLRNLIIQNNMADRGGGVGGVTGGSNVTIENCIIRNNNAVVQGGGVEGVPGMTEISDSEITLNVVNNGSLDGSGGGVFLPPFSSALIKNTEITQNVANGSRRGIGGGIASSANAILRGVMIQSNQAVDGTSEGRGGGLYVNRQGYAFVSGQDVSANTAGRGGGIYIAGGSGSVNIGASVTGNTATLGVGNGGGIFCQNSNPPLSIAGSINGNNSDDVVGCGTAVNPPIGTTRTEGDNDNSGNSNDPVNTRTGALYDQYDPDIFLGGPIPLLFARYYSSGFKQVGIFANLGDNWRHNFDWRLTRIGTTIHIVDHQGRTIQFVENGAAWDLAGKLDIVYQLNESAGLYTLLDPRNQRSYTFDEAGLLISIADGRGNLLSLSYADGPLSQVSDGLGRVLNLTYDTDNRLAQVDDGMGRMVTFGYTGTYLTSVTDLNGDTTTYQYSTLASHLNLGLMTRTFRPEGNVPFVHGFWADDKSSSETDSNGHKTIFTYVSATETTIEDPLGRVRTHTHTATGELSGSTDNTRQNIAIGSDATGRRNSITDRFGDVTMMSYHAPSGRLASRTNADATTTSFSYTARPQGGNTAYDLTGITHANSATETFAYDALGRMTSHVDPEGNTTALTYNDFGQPLTATNPLGGVETFTYDTDQTLATGADPAGNTTTYAYDGFRRLMRITRADMAMVDFTYDAADRLLSTMDENGHLTSFAYDTNGNLTTITDPLLDATAFAYDGNDRLLSVTEPRGGVTSQTYDELGRIGTTTDALANVTTFGYDVHNRLTAITDPLGNTWSTGYDLEGVVASSTDPLSNTTSFTSDKMGRITQVTSPLGNATDFVYDPMGRIISTTNPLGETTTLTRDARGLISGIDLPGGTISASYARNELGQITAVTDPGGNVWTRGYDSSGRLTSRTDPLMQSTTLTYDSRNRPDVITYPGGLGTQTLSYDPVGNLTTVSYSDGLTLGFTYDDSDRLTAANSGGPDDVTRAYDADGRISDTNGIAITRDLKGRITGMNLAAGKDVTYTYDAADRLASVSDWAGGVITFAYDDAGRMTGINRPNGVNSTQTWDDDARLIGITEGTLSDISLTRDGKGQITAATRDVPQSASAAAIAPSGYTFDAAGQIETGAYDPAGRLTALGSDTYTWNLAEHLTSYTRGGVTVTNTYDALGRRTSRTAGGVTRDYVWNDALALESISIELQGGADLRYYIHTPDGELLYGIDANTNARHFYHYDEMGNTLFATDDSGAVIGSYAYTPFGRLIGSSGNLDNPFTWQGRIGATDEGNGFYYIRARYYDGEVGRFVSRDPIEQTGPKSVNPYQYAWGNPMRFIDYSGRAPRPNLGIAPKEHWHGASPPAPSAQFSGAELEFLEEVGLSPAEALKLRSGFINNRTLIVTPVFGRLVGPEAPDRNLVTLGNSRYDSPLDLVPLSNDLTVVQEVRREQTGESVTFDWPNPRRLNIEETLKLELDLAATDLFVRARQFSDPLSSLANIRYFEKFGRRPDQDTGPDSNRKAPNAPSNPVLDSVVDSVADDLQKIVVLL